MGNAANFAIARTIPLLGDHHDQRDGGKPQERGASIAEQSAPRRGDGNGRIGTACPSGRRRGVGGDCGSRHRRRD